MARISVCSPEWFHIWYEDKAGILDTMIRNLASDLSVGYNPLGNSVRKQRADIESYKAQMDREIEDFKHMSEGEVNRWCYYDLKKRGVI